MYTWCVKRFVTIFAVLAVLFLAAKDAEAHLCTISSNLRLGSNSEEVRCLQELLNESGFTIASSGPGSPGKESTYFGRKTFDAIKRFQEANAAEVLHPAGLRSGNGFVGPRTRERLLTFRPDRQSGAGASTGSGTTKTAPQPKVSESGGNELSPYEKRAARVPESSPNRKDLEDFLEAIDTVGKKQGFSAEHLASLQEGIVDEIAATTTNFRAEFVKQMQASNSIKFPEPVTSGWGDFFDTLSYKLFLAPTVYAAESVTNNCYKQNQTCFGAQMFYVMLCTCSGNWLMGLRPYPPSYVVLLTHYMGAQAYLNYNVPFAMYMLGFYVQNQGQCEFYVGTGCISIPNQGGTTPTLGSSEV